MTEQELIDHHSQAAMLFLNCIRDVSEARAKLSARPKQCDAVKRLIANADRDIAGCVRHAAYHMSFTGMSTTAIGVTLHVSRKDIESMIAEVEEESHV
jgi:hypothetical protein